MLQISQVHFYYIQKDSRCEIYFSFILVIIFEEIDFSKIKLESFEILYAGILSGGAAFALQIFGQKNISSAPGGALNGLIVRKHDKFERIKNLFFNKKDSKPQFETLRESFIDDLNYSAIAMMVIDGKWPE